MDLNFLASNMANLCGMPCRIYTDNIKTNFFSVVRFPKDPAVLIEKELSKYNDNIGYFYDDDFFYYGYVNYQNKKLLLGPARIIKPDNQLLAKLILSLDISKDDSNDFAMAIRSIIPMPLESMMLSLSSLNYVLNNEKRNINEIVLNKQPDTVNDNIQKKNADEKLSYSEQTSEHNTFDIENKIIKIIEHGQINELKSFLNNAPAVRGGVMSNDALRQMKNIFITTVTLASRAAIKGGEDVNEALSISDLYIQKAESLKQYNEIASLQVAMILDYTRRVSKIRGNADASSFLISINKYINDHISEHIKYTAICKALYFSKSVLFDKIRKETGMTLNNYILNYKINESKDLLKYSDHSISSISQYLGFSSQSHYNKTFKLFTGITPRKYRENHQK